MAYIGKSPGTGIRNRFIYTATAGQTTFSGTDDHNRTLSYTDAEFTDVFLNGVKLDKSDYTATSSTSIVLDSGATVGDTLEILAFDTFSVFSGDFSQDVTVGGDLTTPSINGGQIGGRRNLIVNGGMQVSQRGTSETGVGAVIKYANAPDRVKYVSLNSAGTHEYTISQSTTTPDGFSHSYKLDCTTADTSLASDVAVFLSVSPMEGQNLQHLQYGTSGAKSVTLSFHVRSNKTGTYVIELYSSDTGKHIAKTYTIDSADTWEKKTLTFVGDTASALDNDNARSLEVLVWLGAGSNYNSGTIPSTWATLVDANRCVGQTVNLADNTANEFFITGVQLEVGSVATEFEHRSFGEELELCRRYFQDYTAGDRSAYRNIGSGTFGTTTSIRVQLVFSPVMRATPSMTTSGNFECFGPSGANLSSIVLTRAYPSGGAFQAVSSIAESQGFGTSVRTDNDTTATLFLDAEL